MPLHPAAMLTAGTPGAAREDRLRSLRPVLPALAPLLFVACLGNPPPPGGGMGAEAARAERAATPEDAIVIDRDALARSDDLLLYVLVGQVPSVSVNYDPESSSERCPRLSLRGPLVGTGLSNPVVYVNGTRTSDTCVLVNIRSTEISWVELYPTGTTRRPGYVTHPHGLILVFTRRI